MSRHLWARARTLQLGAARIDDRHSVSAFIRKAVLCELAWAADDDGHVPAHRTTVRGLAELLELGSLHPIQWALQSLVADGWVERDEAPSRRPVPYRLSLDRFTVEQSGVARSATPVSRDARHENFAARDTVSRDVPHGVARRAAVLDIDIDLGAADGTEPRGRNGSLISQEAIEAAREGLASFRAALADARAVLHLEEAAADG